MTGSKLTPAKLRLILFALMFLLVVAAVAIFMLGYARIKSYSQEAQATSAQALASNNSLQSLAATKNELQKNTVAVKRANQLVSESQSYVYQDQIISDINKYATEAGLRITNITFTDTKTTQVAASAPAAGASGSSATPGTAAASSPTGVNSKTASITLENPVDYNSILTFMHLIEQSLFRMQVAQVGLSRSTDTAKGPNKITSDTLNLEVYVR